MTARIEYSEKYMDSEFEYRHVILPKQLAKSLPQKRLLSEDVSLTLVSWPFSTGFSS